jgi:formylmethanofuran dehydrogenase subunit C
MQIVKLSPKKHNKIPIEADKVNPENFAGKTEAEIEAVLVWHGNRQCFLGKFFEVSVVGRDSTEI